MYDFVSNPLVSLSPCQSTLIGRLRQKFPQSFGFSVSHTSRSPRPGEVNGEAYHFSNRDEMDAMRERGEFIETAIYSGNMYGTSKKALQDVIDAGKIPLLDIDLQGVRSVKQAGIFAKFIFIEPPSVEEVCRCCTLCLLGAIDH
jgi:guanylate kinase